MDPEFGPVFGASECWHFPRAQKTVAFWSLHFGAGEPLSSSFLESHNLDAERPFLQQHSRRTPKCSQLMFALNTYSFQTIKLKLAAFLPSAAPTGEAPWVFRSRKWARENRTKARRRRCLAKIFPNPSRHSRRSVSDGVIQLRVPLAGCAGFFLQAPIPRRILTKMSGAICCMNMRFAKRSWEHPCFYCFPPQRGCSAFRK